MMPLIEKRPCARRPRWPDMSPWPVSNVIASKQMSEIRYNERKPWNGKNVDTGSYGT